MFPKGQRGRPNTTNIRAAENAFRAAQNNLRRVLEAQYQLRSLRAVSNASGIPINNYNKLKSLANANINKATRALENATKNLVHSRSQL
jgi:hypothetical protein